MKIIQREIDSNSAVGIADAYNHLLENAPKVKKNTKIYKAYEKKLDDLRLAYNCAVGFDAFILNDEENKKEWKVFKKNN